jgi:hypothetical protein
MARPIGNGSNPGSLQINAGKGDVFPSDSTWPKILASVCCALTPVKETTTQAKKLTNFLMLILNGASI